MRDDGRRTPADSTHLFADVDRIDANRRGLREGHHRQQEVVEAQVEHHGLFGSDIRPTHRERLSEKEATHHSELLCHMKKPHTVDAYQMEATS